MATNSVQIPGARGLTQGSTEANRSARIDNVKAEIGKLSEQEAKGLLTDISTMTANKRGYLRLDGSGGKGGGQLQFSARWNLNVFRSAKTEVTRAALDALFDQAKLDKSNLDALFPQNAGNGQGAATTAPISNRRVSEAINRAIGGAQTAEQTQAHQALQRSLQQYRTVQFDGRQVGGAARPHGAYIKDATQAETFDQLRKAGYNTILSIDKGDHTTDMARSVPQAFHHETGDQFAIVDFAHPSIRTLAQIKNFVDSAHQQDGKVLIHCGAGAGRTGTVLASLVLADLVKQERARKPDYSVADAGQNIVNVEVEYSHDPGDDEPPKRAKTIPVPKILADAINIVRQADQDTAYKDQSVETDYQVGGLMTYLGYLLGGFEIDGKRIS
ncbi:MAG: dual specificity protein phosphatase family protein [Betaproteobacteria bacterium]|nr:dual specificity protein phosphatase family protein [Betaproteobacteria bacterium]